MTFGEKVRASRKKMSLTQEDLADIIGVSRRIISLYEADKIRPGNQHRYLSLAEALHVNVNYLLTEDDQIFEGSSDLELDTRRGCETVINQVSVLFSGGNLPEEDMDALMKAIQESYIEAKTQIKLKESKTTD